MALTEETVIDRIEILQDGQMQVRKARVIYDDGKEISRTFHRETLDPARDQAVLAEKDQRVQDVAAAVWTPEVVSAREEVVAAQAEREQATTRGTVATVTVGL